MNIGIISDGSYGDRAFENIKRVFDATWTLVPDIPPTTMLDEDIDLHVPECDLIISYVRHPDIILQIARLQKPLILAISPGLGLLQQAKNVNPRVIGAKTMCSLDPNSGIPEIDEFARFFGRPRYRIEMAQQGVVESIETKRSAPCGSSEAGACFLKGKSLTTTNMNDFALAVCHECRAPRFGHTCDKEVSGLIHMLALLECVPEEVLLDDQQGLMNFKHKVQEEYLKRAGT